MRNSIRVPMLVAALLAALFMGKLMYDMVDYMGQMTTHVAAMSQDVAEMNTNMGSMAANMASMEQTLRQLRYHMQRMDQTMHKGSEQIQRWNPMELLNQAVPSTPGRAPAPKR